MTVDEFELAGITPTPVGNTNEPGELGPDHGDHPHTCGEYPTKRAAIRNKLGSPPHLWGIHLRTIVPGSLTRITPTPVGNTVFSM